MEQARHTTDLTDEQWGRVQAVLPEPRNGRRGAGPVLPEAG